MSKPADVDESTKTGAFVDELENDKAKEIEEPVKLPHEKNPCSAFSSLICGCIFMMLPGQVYCTGVFATYIQSYY